jgi:hypothetical protein
MSYTGKGKRMGTYQDDGSECGYVHVQDQLVG